VVVEVLGIRILHLANLECGWRRMVFMLGSGRSENSILLKRERVFISGKGKNPLDSIFAGLNFCCGHGAKSWSLGGQLSGCVCVALFC